MRWTVEVPQFSLFFLWKRGDTQRPEVTRPCAWEQHRGDVVDAAKGFCDVLGIGTASTLELESFVGFAVLALMAVF